MAETPPPSTRTNIARATTGPCCFAQRRTLVKLITGKSVVTEASGDVEEELSESIKSIHLLHRCS
jgi:hypothetical protein